jgi:hypothetical protein
MPEGETLLIIYIKMLLRGIRSDGSVPVILVHFRHTLMRLQLRFRKIRNLYGLPPWHLQKLGAIDVLENEDICMLQLPTMIGTESDSARRMRELREREKMPSRAGTSHCDKSDAHVTQRQS